MSRALPILALLALLVQCSPLRTCGWQFILAGTSCHDGDETASSEFAMPVVDDGCAPHAPDGHEDACVCERPAASADRGVQHSGSAGVPPALPVADVLILPSPLGAATAPFDSPDLAPAPTIGRHLPLLL